MDNSTTPTSSYCSGKKNTVIPPIFSGQKWSSQLLVSYKVAILTEHPRNISCRKPPAEVTLYNVRHGGGREMFF